MAILTNDRFLIQRSGSSYRVDASLVAAMAEDTLQSATDRGNHTTESLEVGGTAGSANVNIGADGTVSCTDLVTQDIRLNNEGRGNEVDGTWGNWTLQEGEENLFLINNRSGMKFKISMEPV